MDFEGGAGAGGEGGEGGGLSATDVFGVGAGGGEQGGEGGGQGAEGQGGEGGGGAADPEWYGQVSSDLAEGEKASLRDWLKASNVKDINALAKVARDNQAALRESGRVKVPGEGASDAEVKAFHAAIGVPEDASGYKLAAVKDADGNDVKMNQPLLDRLAGVAHAAGVPKAGYEAMVNDFVQWQMEEMATANAAEQADAAAKFKEWGAQGNAKLGAINSALEALGLSRDEALALRGALGAGRSMDLLSKLGEGIAEDVMMTGGGSGKFGISGAQAQEQINSMMKDADTAAKIRVPGTPERERYNRLQQIAGADADRRAAALG